MAAEITAVQAQAAFLQEGFQYIQLILIHPQRRNLDLIKVLYILYLIRCVDSLTGPILMTAGCIGADCY
jgi:hypothetical protein